MTIEEVWYGRSAGAAAARAALAPLSLLYGAALRLRGAAWDLGLQEPRSAPAPVISVGGLRVGGAGKTPFVLWLAAALKKRGLRPCVVTRGYGGRGEGGPPRLLTAAMVDETVVADVGDEAALLALRSGCPVAVGSDRAAACALAWSELAAAGDPPSVFLLDDGFQHRALARAVDVVMVDGREAGEWLLPAGPLREGAGALARAGVVVVLGPGGALPSQRAGQLVVRAEARPECLVAAVGDDAGEDLARLSGLRVVAVAAVARPERFLADLEGLGARVVARVLRRDHHRYDDADRREIEAASARADLVVTTEKDLVKLAGGAGPAPRRRALRLRLRVDDEDALLDRVCAPATAPPSI